MDDVIRVATIVGNPVSPSRTAVAAARFGEVLADLGGEVTTVDLALIGVDGLAHGRPEPEAQAALDAVVAADLLLAVTPIFKGSYSGLLKLLFDALPADALGGKCAIPVMLGAWPGHFLAIEHALKPVFVALGAQPAKGLFVMEKTIDKQAGTVDPAVLEDFRSVAQHAVRLTRALAEHAGSASG